jgi:4-hydroxybenzoate polyprenyltransferase
VHGDEPVTRSVLVRDCIRIARPDHWVKHVFILPGVALAVVMLRVPVTDVLLPFAIGLASACLIASANYTINEWLDAEFDKFHPVKKQRPAVSGRLWAGLVYTQFAALAATGLSLGALVSRPFLGVSAVFLASGIIYNVRPLRTKDKPYLDVLSEAINNPIRLMLGWTMVTTEYLPPSSLMLSYWMGGAFLMAAKRLAEFRHALGIQGREALSLYRASFRWYSEERLIVFCFFCAILSAFFLAVFLIKYRIEYVFSFPLFAVLFAWYLKIGLETGSAAQSPEDLHREWGLIVFVGVLVAVIAVLTVVDMPSLAKLVDPRLLRW